MWCLHWANLQTHVVLFTFLHSWAVESQTHMNPVEIKVIDQSHLTCVEPFHGKECVCPRILLWSERDIGQGASEHRECVHQFVLQITPQSISVQGKSYVEMIDFMEINNLYFGNLSFFPIRDFFPEEKASSCPGAKKKKRNVVGPYLIWFGKTLYF